MLVTVDEVIASMGLSVKLKADLTATITSNIKKAQVKLGADLGCSIEQYACVDRVHLNSDLYSGVTPQGMLRVKLSNLFVNPTSIKTTVSTAIGEVGTKIKPLMVDAEQGNVYYPLEFDGKFLSISYESGIDPTEVPEEVRQALLLYVSMIFAETQPDKSDTKPAAAVNDLALSMAATYRKVPAFAFRPFSHTQTLL